MARYWAVAGAVIVWCAGSTAQVVKDIWADQGDLCAFHVVVSADADADERAAAETFRTHWGSFTGVTPRMSAINEGLFNVWIGRSAVGAGLLTQGDLDALGPEEFILRTYTPTRREAQLGAKKQLIIAAGTGRGALNGVYEFLQRYAGMRWFSSENTYVPRTAASLSPMNVQVSPLFPRRCSGYEAFVQEEAARDFRCAHHMQPFPAAGIPGAGALGRLLPPERLFAAHPEFYAERSGVRNPFPPLWPWELPSGNTAGDAVFCLSCPGLAEALIGEIAQRLEAQAPEAPDRALFPGYPDDQTIDLSPAASDIVCDCASCRAVLAEEGAPSGLLLQFANRVAAGLTQAFPGKELCVRLLLSGVNRRPPSMTRPGPRVLVEVSATECDARFSLADATSALNAAFVADVRKWTSLTGNMLVRDYACSMADPLYPYPNLAVLAGNLQLLDQLDVRSVTLAARAPGRNGPGAEDGLRTYLTALLLWDPDTSMELARDEFLRAQYGAAGPKIRAVLDLAEKRARQSESVLHPLQGLAWLDGETVEQMNAILEEAATLKLNEDQRLRLREAVTTAQYAAFACPPRAEVSGAMLVLERPAAPPFDELHARLLELPRGDTAAAHLREVFAGAQPPRHEETPLVVLENARQLVWILPERGGTVVRWQDKETGRELVPVFPAATLLPPSMGMQHMRPDGVAEPIAGAFEVTGRADGEVSLSTEAIPGLRLTRTLRLSPGDVSMTVVLDTQNTGTEPVRPALRLHASFRLEAPAAPQYWFAPESGSAPAPENISGAPFRAGVMREPMGSPRWGVRMAEGDTGFEQGIVAGDTGRCYMYHDLGAAVPIVCFDLDMADAPLAPGETRRSETVLRFTGPKRPETPPAAGLWGF